jgi:Glycosyl hydrolases family 2, sugar binding domain/Glycosyl hydrolases family 2, TIM barrel domain/Glycosyl hydrolases family 2
MFAALDCFAQAVRIRQPDLFRLIVAFLILHPDVAGAGWKPAAGPLLTRWAKDVSPDKSHPEYPRPQMVRSSAWTNLNGLWDYAVRPKGEDRPTRFDGSILVPFPVESALSGAMRRITPEETVWYRRSFSIPDSWRGRRILLHFGAVDWEATVWIDARKIGAHRGGYSPFTFDVTDAVVAGKRHELILSVWDPSDAGTQPRGKQALKPHRSRYTPTTGIWQTVWLETVGQSYFRNLSFDPEIPTGKVTLTTDVAGPSGDCVLTANVESPEAGETTPERILIASARGPAGKPLTISIPPRQVRLWSPDTPFLYDVEVRLTSRDGQLLDTVESYFALRCVAISRGPDVAISRILLNGKPVFLIGPLDQGFWPDGLYAAPTDDALRYDLEIIKRLGFNLVRKHVKVEPARWYYWCDRLGLVVFQDMPNGDRSAHGKREIERSAESARQFETELREMIDCRRAFPCIAAWVAFNEGWGQFDTVRISRWIKAYDPSRLVVAASGWNDFPVGDIRDVHNYPGPSAPPADPARATVLGEFGGLGLAVDGHLWAAGKNWGYLTFQTSDALTAEYLHLAKKLEPLVASRLSAAVYTQTTDVETEINGLMTYDRELVKVDAAKVRAANKRLIDMVGAK